MKITESQLELLRSLKCERLEKADEHCVAISMYDFTCQFMSQKTRELEGKRGQFFEEFNN